MVLQHASIRKRWRNPGKVVGFDPGRDLKENRGASIGGLRRPSALNPENQEAYGVFLTVYLFRSGDSSVHHTGPRSPSFRLTTSTRDVLRLRR
jgi:hypothetical protein